jgi:predicted RNase H-like HicB family nuclease
MQKPYQIVFEVHEEPEGGFSAEAIGESIFTQGDTWEDLREMVQDATKAYFFDVPDQEHPSSIRLMLRKDEVLSVA